MQQQQTEQIKVSDYLQNNGNNMAQINEEKVDPSMIKNTELNNL